MYQAYPFSDPFFVPFQKDREALTASYLQIGYLWITTLALITVKIPISMEEVRVKADISPLYLRLYLRLVTAFERRERETERKLEGLEQ